MNSQLSLSVLRESVLVINPNTDLSILDHFLQLVEKHDLRWVPSPFSGQGACFVMSQLSVAKGLDSDDYRRNWSSSTIGEKQLSSNSLAGREHKIEGIPLKTLKQDYKNKYGESLGRVNSLYIGDWQRCYAYLTQGYSPAARDFQKLGARSIESLASSAAEKTLTEEDVQKLVMELIAYSSIKFRFEAGVKSPYDRDVSYRRFDFIEQTPRAVRIYELKIGQITEQHVRETLLDKRYCHVAAEKFPGRTIEFVFTSPQGITWEAQELLNDLTSGKGYVTILNSTIKPIFIDLRTIVQRLVQNVIRCNPPEQLVWLYNKLINTDLRFAVSPLTISKLKARIDEGYSTGLLTRKNQPTLKNSENSLLNVVV